MARFVIAGIKETDDPTMATLPFIASQTAHEQAHDVVLWLQAEAVVFAKKGVIDSVQGVGLPCSRTPFCLKGFLCGSVQPVRRPDKYTNSISR